MFIELKLDFAGFSLFLSIITVLLVDCVQLERYKVCLFFLLLILKSVSIQRQILKAFVCSFISHAYHIMFCNT